MGVSASGASGRSVAKIGTAAAVVSLLGAVAFYLYGPVVVPALHDGATSECNRLTGGNYRSYQLDWVVGARPHWVCRNRARPAEPPVDLGWWVEPHLWGRP